MDFPDYPRSQSQRECGGHAAGGQRRAGGREGGFRTGAGEAPRAAKPRRRRSSAGGEAPQLSRACGARVAGLSGVVPFCLLAAGCSKTTPCQWNSSAGDTCARAAGSDRRRSPGAVARGPRGRGRWRASANFRYTDDTAPECCQHVPHFANNRQVT